MSRTRIIVLTAIVGIAMVMTLAIPAQAMLDDCGCTPGFWKQDQHFSEWIQYDPDALFDDVFGVGSFTGGTLLDALGTIGGGEAALMRHAVAALLNAIHPEVDFPFTEAEVIAEVQDAYATGNFETAKNLLETRKGKNCPF